MKNVLITGGAGFIGSSIARRMIKSDHKIVIVDNLKTGLSENIPSNCEFIEIDIREKNEILKLKKMKFDAVLHLAAQSSGELSHDDPNYDLDTNSRGTLNMLQFASEMGIGRFINASSMGVYGDVRESECPVFENKYLTPLSFYGVSKLSAEMYCNYYMTKGMNITSFRMFNVYGPGQNLDNTKQGMVSIFMKFIIENQSIHVKGSKNRFRDLIFIEDVVDAWISSIDEINTFNKVYNLGTGIKTNISEIVNELLVAFSKDIDSYPIRYEGNTAADQFGIYANIDSLKSDLNWQPKFNINIGFKKLAEVYG